jgi:hypothetical protein
MMDTQDRTALRSHLREQAIQKAREIRDRRKEMRRLKVESRRLRVAGEPEAATALMLDAVSHGHVPCWSERSRCLNLARGFLRGLPYTRIEKTTRTPKWYLYDNLAKEVASNAEVEYDDVVGWFRGEACKTEQAEAA